MWRTDEAEKNVGKPPKKDIQYFCVRVRAAGGCAFPAADGADSGELLYDFK